MTAMEHHDLVVAAARTVGVELAHRHLMFDQVLTGGRGFLERPGGRDVVRGDHVAKKSQRTCALDVRDLSRFGTHALEVRSA